MWIVRSLHLWRRQPIRTQKSGVLCVDWLTKICPRKQFKMLACLTMQPSPGYLSCMTIRTHQLRRKCISTQLSIIWSRLRSIWKMLRASISWSKTTSRSKKLSLTSLLHQVSSKLLFTMKTGPGRLFKLISMDRLCGVFVAKPLVASSFFCPQAGDQYRRSHRYEK